MCPMSKTLITFRHPRLQILCNMSNKGFRKIHEISWVYLQVFTKSHGTWHFRVHYTFRYSYDFDLRSFCSHIPIIRPLGGLCLTSTYRTSGFLSISRIDFFCRIIDQDPVAIRRRGDPETFVRINDTYRTMKWSRHDKIVKELLDLKYIFLTHSSIHLQWHRNVSPKNLMDIVLNSLNNNKSCFPQDFAMTIYDVICLRSSLL